jgi:WD40 repeat protein
VLLFSVAEQAPIGTLQTPGLDKLGSLAFSPDGKFLAAAYRSDKDSHLLLWDCASRAVKEIRSDLGIPLGLVFGMDGKYLACAGERGGMLWEVPGLQRLPVPRFGFLSSASFSPDHTLVAFADKHGPITLWDFQAVRELAELSYTGMPHTVMFSRDAKHLIAANTSSVRLWNLAGADEKIVLSGHEGAVPSSTFSPDGKLLASAGKDRTVKIWNPGTGQLLRTLDGFRASVQTVAFSPDGKVLATGDWSSDIRFWEVASWEELPRLDHPLGQDIWAIAFGSKDKLFAACGKGGLVIGKVDLSSAGRRSGPRLVLRELQRPSKETIGSLSFSPDNSLLAWVSLETSQLHLWDVVHCRAYEFPRLKVKSAIRGLAFSQDGLNVVFIGERSVPEVWNVATKQKVLPSFRDDLGVSTDWGFVHALSADNVHLAVQGRRVCVWDMRSRKLLVQLPEERRVVYGLAWSPNEKLLAVSGGDGGPVIWNLAKIKAQLDQIGLAW